MNITPATLKSCPGTTGIQQKNAADGRVPGDGTALCRLLLVSLLAVVMLLGGTAHADTITVTGIDNTRGQSIWIKENNVDTQAYFAGVILITLNGLYARDTLCVDLFTDISLSTYGTNVLRPDQVPGKNLTRVSWLVDNVLLPTQNNTYTSLLPQADWVTTPAQGAGIQLAIWDIVHDNGDGLASGSVQAVTNPANPTDAQVQYWANLYLAASLGNNSDLSYVYNNVNLSTGLPVQMLAGPLFQDGGPAPTPEPATLLLLGGGLAGLAGMRFRKRRR